MAVQITSIRVQPSSKGLRIVVRAKTDLGVRSLTFIGGEYKENVRDAVAALESKAAQELAAREAADTRG
jgi:hypothetical protein